MLKYMFKYTIFTLICMFIYTIAGCATVQETTLKDCSKACKRGHMKLFESDDISCHCDDKN